MEEVHVFTVQKLYGLLGGLMGANQGEIRIPLVQVDRQQYLMLPESVMQEVARYLPAQHPSQTRRESEPPAQGPQTEPKPPETPEPPEPPESQINHRPQAVMEALPAPKEPEKLPQKLPEKTPEKMEEKPSDREKDSDRRTKR